MKSNPMEKSSQSSSHKENVVYSPKIVGRLLFVLFDIHLPPKIVETKTGIKFLKFHQELPPWQTNELSMHVLPKPAGRLTSMKETEPLW